MNNIVRTEDFVTKLADKGYTKKDSATIVKDVFSIFAETIEEGDSLSIIGLGSIKVIETKGKRIKNIRTGEFMNTKPHKRVKYSPGIAIRRALEILEEKDEE